VINHAPTGTIFQRRTFPGHLGNSFAHLHNSPLRLSYLSEAFHLLVGFVLFWYGAFLC